MQLALIEQAAIAFLRDRRRGSHQTYKCRIKIDADVSPPLWSGTALIQRRPALSRFLVRVGPSVGSAARLSNNLPAPRDVHQLDQSRFGDFIDDIPVKTIIISTR